MASKVVPKGKDAKGTIDEAKKLQEQKQMLQELEENFFKDVGLDEEHHKGEKNHKQDASMRREEPEE